ELLFVALGGSGEIGMNVNLYGCRGQWIMVDLGLTFADPTYPGVELILPELEFIERQQDRLAGIVLTHGHEDHIGALPYLAEELKAPLFATPFTAGLIAGKLEEEGLTGHVKLNVVERGGSIELGPFRVSFVALSHSIPEGNGLLIETPFGNIFHTGDWKIDETPVLGSAPDTDVLTEIGDRGVLALVCDSTNVFQDGPSGSEESVHEGLLAQTMIASGGQGEPRAALGRIASGSHELKLSQSDTVIFSSRIIPGNETAIGRIMNQLSDLGVQIVTERQAHVHVSGHPGRPELIEMYEWVRPQIVVPVHGEARHMAEQGRLALSHGVPH